MKIKYSSKISEEDLKVLKSLKKAVNKDLDKKKKLGQYAIIWDGTKPVKYDFKKS